MKKLIYEKHLKEYIKIKQSILNNLKRFKLGDFQKLHFLSTDININNANKWGERLCSNGVDINSPILYYFKLNPDIDIPTLKNYFKAIKEKKRTIAFSKLNETSTSYILYVGITSRNFENRFIQHLGYGANKTYAMHLSEWAPKLNIEIELYYQQLNLNIKNMYLLEEIEHVFHYAMKPILGRSGH